MDISTKVNTKISQQGSNHLLSVKRIKIEKGRVENIIMRMKFIQKEKLPEPISDKQKLLKRCKKVTLLKSLKLVPLVQLIQLVY